MAILFKLKVYSQTVLWATPLLLELKAFKHPGDLVLTESPYFQVWLCLWPADKSAVKPLCSWLL